MKLHEVLEQYDENSNLWFRPVSWKGAKQAFVSKGGTVYNVPSPRGGEFGITPYIEYLKADWELVNSHDVLNGK